MSHTVATGTVVVGAGPTGLLTALLLARQGVRVEVYDKDRRTAVHSYALAIHPATLRLLDGVGLAGALVAAGRTVERLAIHVDGAPVAEIDITRLGGTYPFVLVLPQSALERALESALEALGVRIHWNHRVQRVTQDDSGVELSVARLEQVAQGYPVARLEWVVDKEFTARAPLVVAADGHDSFVRRALGIGTTSLADARSYAVYEFNAEPPPPPEAALALRRGAADSYWPIGPDRGRWSFEAGEAPREERLPALLADRAPWFGARPSRIGWSSLVTFEHAIANAVGDRRVLLAGDAARLMSPVGVQSMNLALGEAAEIVERIADAPHEPFSGPWLDQYAEAHRRRWRALADVAPPVAALARAPRPLVPWAERLPSLIPASGEDLERLLDQLGFAFDASGSPRRS